MQKPPGPSRVGLSRDLATKAGFGLALLIFAVIGLQSYRSTEGLIQHAGEVSRTYNVIGGLDDLLADVLTCESAARGYVLSGEESLLGPYSASARRVKATVQDLPRMVAGSPAQQRSIRALQAAATRKLELLEQEIELRRTKGHEAASALILTGKGNRLMSQVQALITEVKREESRLLGERSAQARYDARMSVLTLLVGSLLSFSILLAVYYSLDRQIARRKRSEQEIRRLNESLEKRIEARTAELSVSYSQLERRNLEIERANKLKSEFLARMSHELRTPMNAILGFSDLLSEEAEGPLNETYRRFVGHIRHGAWHLLALINDVLDISRIEAGRIELAPEEFGVTDATTEVLSVARPLAEVKKIQVQNQVGPQYAYADRTRFKQILYNLLSNAVKFTPEGGTVWVAASQEGDHVSITVGDSGVGIPPDEHQAIFEEFHQVGPSTSGVKEGTGLGLAITKRLVELQGGAIRVDSKPGEGSRFTFSLPSAGRSAREAVG